MNVRKHSFSKESKKDLFEFLITAIQEKDNAACDSKQYKIWKEILPLGSDLENELKAYQESKFIQIDDNSQETKHTDSQDLSEILMSQSQISITDKSEAEINISTVDDIIYAITENLETLKSLSESVLKDLTESNNENLEKTYSLLSNSLNLEQVINFGESLKEIFISNEHVLLYYVQHLLLPKVKCEYSDKLLNIFIHIMSSYNTLTIPFLAKTLLEINKDESKLLYQFITAMDDDVKTAIFRDLIFSCVKLEEKHIHIIEILFNKTVEFNSISKLIELMSNTTDLNSDKGFGKLILNILNCLGKNVLTFHQPLQRLIGQHNSIWKSKIQKTFNDSYEDNLMLSQSFKC